DGSVTVTNAIGIPVTQASPGIFAELGKSDPRPAFAFHASSYATGTIAVDGTIAANDVATVTIEDRKYSYTVQSSDTLAPVRDALIALITAGLEEKVTAPPAAAYTRVRLRAKVPGPEGEGITFGGSSTGSTANSTGSVILTALNSALCCANRA